MRSFLAFAVLSSTLAAPALAQDPAAGEKVFTPCKACHQIGETAKNAVGPVLNGMIGRKVGTVEGYNYSPANFRGGQDDQKITDLIAFLKQYDPLERKHRDAGGELVLILAATVGVVFAILAFAISWGIRCWEGLGPLVGDHR